MVAGDQSGKSGLAKKQRSPIVFPEDNTEFEKKTQESKKQSVAKFRKQSPSATSPVYIGLNITREHAVSSVLTRLLPIPEDAVRIFADVLDTGKEVVVIVSEYRAANVLGYARITSADLGPHSVGTIADVYDVNWIKFGEFSKNIFSHMPALIRSHANGTLLPSGLGMKSIRLMDACAHQYSLPTPVTVASNWRELMTARQPSMSHMAQPPGGFGIHGALRRRQGMMEDPPPTKRARHGAVPRHGGDHGGFISRHGSDHTANGARVHHAIPPAILAVLADAPVMQERPTARKRLVELSYEEYLDVYGRIEEEWHRRQLKQAYINHGLKGKGASPVA